MNTGEIIDTTNLILKPGNNNMDNEPFIKMLRDDGNFKDFCGIPYSDKHLAMFINYFEHEDGDQCLYSVYHKNNKCFVGYVGFHREHNGYELEFYIGKEYRRHGFCEEACIAVMKKLFCDGVSVNGNTLKEETLYATTLPDNIAAIGLLRKLGFENHHVSADGAILVAEAFYNEEEDDFCAYPIAKYMVEKKNFLM